MALVSDYRYRGVTLSRGNPAAQVTVAYDDIEHWYAGAFASTAQLAEPSDREVHGLAFAGYARRLPSGLTWDFGANYSAFTGPLSYNYAEAYVGVAFENVSARVSYAPRYFGLDSRAVYGEVNGALPLADHVRLVAHAGVLGTNGANPYRTGPDHVFDGRAGVGIDLDPFHVELSWIGISAATAAYPFSGARSRNTAVLTLSLSF